MEYSTPHYTLTSAVPDPVWTKLHSLLYGAILNSDNNKIIVTFVQGIFIQGTFVNISDILVVTKPLLMIL